MFKRCQKCGVSKHYTAFVVVRKSKNGHAKVCVDCLGLTTKHSPRGEVKYKVEENNV